MTNNAPSFARASSSNSSLHQLTNKQIARLFKDDNKVPTTLMYLEMAVYVDEAQRTYIGLSDTNISEHDRWFFTYDRVDDNEGKTAWVWTELASESDPTNVQVLGEKPQPVKDRLFELQGFVNITSAQLAVEQGHLLGATEILSVARTINRYDDGLLEVDFQVPLEDLHDMVHHPKAYAKRHPETIGLAREHLLAAYGIYDPYLRVPVRA